MENLFYGPGSAVTRQLHIHFVIRHFRLALFHLVFARLFGMLGGNTADKKRAATNTVQIITYSF